MKQNNTITTKAHAKINLFLRVCGRRDDGFHEIQTLFQSIELADRLSQGESFRTGIEAFRKLPPLIRLALASGRGPDNLAAGLRRAADDYRLRAEILARQIAFYLPLALTTLVGGTLVGLFAILMMQPYGRIIVLHIAIIGGAFAIMLLGSPVFLLLILIGGKIWLDVKMHLLERRKNAERAAPGPLWAGKA